jgi:serine/threonine protein kinase
MNSPADPPRPAADAEAEAAPVEEPKSEPESGAAAEARESDAEIVTVKTATAGISNDMPDAPTLLAGRYRLGDELGRGGMGQVWLAHDEILEREVAIKQIDLPEELSGGDAAHRRTLREARAAARLSHPNVVQVYDVLSLDDRTWIVMEYVPCRSLRQVIADDGPLDPYRVARIGVDLLSALQAAHRAGVQHRDVKPANVLLADDGRVLLTDFGIAALDDDSLTSKSDVLLGSPLYMAPERARYGIGGPPADMWGLGATLYSALEGHSPFERSSTMATLAALATEEPEPPQHAGPLVPLLAGLLRKDPAQRMAAEDADQLLRAAVAGLDESGGARATVVPKQRTSVEGGTLPAVPDDRKRTRRLFAAVAAAVLVLIAGLAIFLANRSSSETTAGEKPATTRPTEAATTTPNTAGSAAPNGAPNAAPSATPSAAVTSAKPSSSGVPSQAAGRPPLPVGWKVWNDTTGFSVYIPDGWSTYTKKTMRYWKDGKGHLLGIDQTNKPRSNPVADWKSQRDVRREGGEFPGYDEIKIAPVDYFVKAADWEFTFNKGGFQHVNNRGVVTSAHQAYGFWFQTLDSDWAKYRTDVLEVVFKSFVPDKD